MMDIIYYYRLIKRKNHKTHKKTNIWVFGEWCGDRCCDNCLYLANYISRINSNLSLFWVSNKKCDTSLLDKKITIVEKGSDEAKHLIKESEVIVVNQGLCDITDDSSCVPYNSLIINLWHGMPWKKIMYDVADNSLIRFFKKCLYKKINVFDYLISTSRENSKIIKNAFYLNNNQIIESGYPRNEIFCNEKKLINCKEKLNSIINSNGKLIITYLPTFRNNNAFFDFNSITNKKELTKLLIDNNAIIVQKKHFADDNKFSAYDSPYIFNIDNNISTQELLGASDILITDYSSCFFDFLLLDNPIIHFLYDYEYYYLKDRGLYYDKKDVCCGDCVTTVDELINSIKNNIINKDKDKELRQLRKKQFININPNNSCSIIYNKLVKELQKND